MSWTSLGRLGLQWVVGKSHFTKKSLVMLRIVLKGNHHIQVSLVNSRFFLRIEKPEEKKSSSWEKGDLYPNCDTSIWLRSCEKEVINPIDGVSRGVIPTWLEGSLLRNGPGSLKVGEMEFDHLFDSSALLHR